MDMFRYLNYGLAAVLGFVGLKMIADYLVHTDTFGTWTGIELERDAHLVPGWVNLIVIVSLLGISIIASIVAQKREERLGIADPHHEMPGEGSDEPVLPPEPENQEV
jgi:tellurite resistance protein TerC